MAIPENLTASKFAPLHMRAKIAGYTYACCRDCVHQLEYNKTRYCQIRKNDPMPERIYEHTLCTEFSVGEP